MQNEYKKLFLAANGAEGFVSYFKSCYDPRENWHAYIIKGGPGTGKSTMMKTVAASAKAAGCDPILVYCSSDPDSLDGVIINERKTVLIDGTAPHTVEPSLFGVCEIIVNPGDCLDYALLEKSREDIIDKTDKNKFYHLTASRYLSALGQIKNDSLRLAARCLDTKKANGYAVKLANKYIGKRAQNPGKALNCFLSAYTPKGRVDFTETPFLWCKNTVIIEDKNLAAAGYILRVLSAAATAAGYDTVRLCDPLFPDTAEHLLIPELSLAFLTENDDIRFESDTRRIHTRRFYNTYELKKIRNRMRFNRKVAAQLSLCAAQNLENAKKIHDEIEAYYVEAMDFKAHGKITQKLLKQIFSQNKR